ncbi:RNA methyltransferase [Algiphilus aromaticivorans]|jgi:TrmH family RNA methyltransferase|uniref:RNA methyltransferase n=1 Tax=Algiphilus aromaticivorans TaxID=382454 RepID=UPI000694ACDF|nr:RNA methyltransferase [Algiphilus aromaticivorans]
MKEPLEGAQHSKSTDASLSGLRVVLVRTQHPGNIGATARAMKTMGLSDLALVAPQAPPDEQSWAMASGAVDVLDAMQRFDNLAEALADCSQVVGVSARRRGISLEVSDARSWAGQWAAAPAGRTAIVFGAERTGLTNAELALCQRAVQIPANPDYASLNLAQAVQVLAYECRMAALGGLRGTRPRRPADHATMEGVYEHLERMLVATDFLDPDKPRHLMRRLRRLIARAEPDKVEANILRGMFSAVEKYRGDR